MTYQDQIKSPKWQKKRLEILEMYNFTCNVCKDTSSQLHVHHVYYVKGKKIWEYETHMLSCLCENCHKKIHELNDKLNESLGILEIVCSLYEKEQVLGYIAGLLGRSYEVDPSEAFMAGYVDSTNGLNVSERYYRLNPECTE